jgi:hypothetical protein
VYSPKTLKHLEKKFPIVFGGCLIYKTISSIKEEGFNAYLPKKFSNFVFTFESTSQILSLHLKAPPLAESHLNLKEDPKTRYSSMFLQ